VNKVFTNIYKIAEIISMDEQPCLLCTIGLDGNPRTRFMAGYRIREGRSIYLITFSNSNKITEVKKNSRVQFILIAKDYKRILTLNSEASIVQDVELRRKLYEEGKSSAGMFPVFDDSFGVIHIEPITAEYLEPSVSSNPVVFSLLDKN
jgi:uncharacterized pyridoxamine 5'-phosphate oxidase family protein